jgi:hypothetical protein
MALPVLEQKPGASIYKLLVLQMERRVQADILHRHRVCTGNRAWRNLLHSLAEMDRLYGPFAEFLCSPERVHLF